MKIYFCGSIAGGRKYAKIYSKIVDYLKGKGHRVLSEHIVKDDIFDFEKQFTPQEIFERDIELLNEADVVIAEVSNPSLGVGYEICYAIYNAIEVLCVYQKGLYVSRMITGNTTPGFINEAYENEDELFGIIDDFLNYLTRNTWDENKFDF